MTKCTIYNNFHNTEATVIVNGENAKRFHPNRLHIRLSKNQVYRTQKKLCGIKDCKCGRACGARGPQCVDIDDYCL